MDKVTRNISTQDDIQDRHWCRCDSDTTDHQLTAAGQQLLKVQGYFMGQLKHNDIETEQEIFVVHSSNKPLLGSPAIEALAIVSLVKQVTMQSNYIVKQFPKSSKVLKV